MRVPRLTVTRDPVLGLTLSLLLIIPSASLAGNAGPDRSAGDHVSGQGIGGVPPPQIPSRQVATSSSPADVDDQEEPVTLPPVVCAVVRKVQLLVATMMLAPPPLLKPPVATSSPPPDETTVPIVVRTPAPPTERPTPPVDLGTPTPSSTPEPTSLVSGLVGSGLALAGWLRRRRTGKLANLTPAGDYGEANGDGGELTPQPA